RARGADVLASLPRDERAPARGDANLPLPRIRRLGLRDPRGTAANRRRRAGDFGPPGNGSELGRESGGALPDGLKTRQAAETSVPGSARAARRRPWSVRWRLRMRIDCGVISMN